VSEGEAAHLGEGGEGFYIAQSGRRPDLLVIRLVEMGFTSQWR
jgi:hypothetical protein